MSRPDDITPISAEHHVRTNVPQFFASGRFSPQEAAGHLVLEALLCGAQRVEVQRRGPWWLVRSDRDWLPSPLDQEAFEALVPFPEGGPNAARREILLTVFATDVLVHSGDRPQLVKGRSDADIEALLSSGAFARSVAFRE